MKLHGRSLGLAIAVADTIGVPPDAALRWCVHDSVTPGHRITVTSRAQAQAWWPDGAPARQRQWPDGPDKLGGWTGPDRGWTGQTMAGQGWMGSTKPHGLDRGWTSRGRPGSGLDREGHGRTGPHRAASVQSWTSRRIALVLDLRRTAVAEVDEVTGGSPLPPPWPHN